MNFGSSTYLNCIFRCMWLTNIPKIPTERPNPPNDPFFPRPIVDEQLDKFDYYSTTTLQNVLELKKFKEYIRIYMILNFKTYSPNRCGGGIVLPLVLPNLTTFGTILSPNCC